ncbi:phosphonate metabolism protein/1,5-bisphosphokinase (PRPP-forming) PhnN [Poseidonocella sp. HB161398]|uniref:phosphonate metabolism protein/1,5-bisphosphokinase (PRPP-forming) PhnN n=1 Tax=Poseidonocella sp. HB161398 TaxID=2320855 RepID=UPI001108CE87|nr:phosphonate metabolism protein/1,5-bisphosphokinase (PRPP-forming) PhnN [Poseidonocella sp. HB161398]
MSLEGTLFLVVGPSGVGKDTLLEGTQEQLGEFSFFRFCRRFVTRPEDAGGEDYISVSDEAFDRLAETGALFHHWQAHGLRYGIPADVREDLAAGRHVIINVSRRELPRLAALWREVVVLSVEASPESILARLKTRGRESADAIAARAAREVAMPELDCTVLAIRNDTTVEAGIAAMVRAIVGNAGQHFTAQSADMVVAQGSLCMVNHNHPVAEILRSQGSRVEIVNRAGVSVVAELAYTMNDDVRDDFCLLDHNLARKLDIAADPVLRLRPAPSPQSRDNLRKKIRGEALNAAEMDLVVEDMVRGRYSQAELAAFLVCSAHSLEAEEVVALAKARATRTENVHWAAPIVVDKHSMGGIPGNRISPIIIPIVTAAGLLMPKTSSRAITSASGTADAMEVMARVDLTPDELRKVVAEVGGCIAWNGNLTHSPVDDVMNAINRPLGLKSERLDVSSILSKKLAAGSSHVLIDMPVGPEAKTRDMAEADELERLFVTAAGELGMQARVMKVDGTRPVGRGIGPALEMRDAMAVLRCEDWAPRDLRDKALYYAAIIIEWAGACPAGQGPAMARELLVSGKALAKFQDIIRAQGQHCSEPPLPEPLTHEILAAGQGAFPGFGVWAVSAIARAAGAPLVPTAGVDLLVAPQQSVSHGQPILRIHAATSYALQLAISTAGRAIREGRLILSPGLAILPSEPRAQLIGS